MIGLDCSFTVPGILRSSWTQAEAHFHEYTPSNRNQRCAAVAEFHIVRVCGSHWLAWLPETWNHSWLAMTYKYGTSRRVSVGEQARQFNVTSTESDNTASSVKLSYTHRQRADGHFSSHSGANTKANSKVNSESHHQPNPFQSAWTPPNFSPLSFSY